MNIYLSLAQIGIPEFVKKKKMKELFELTARAFQCDVPELSALSYQELLLRFAHFSSVQAQLCQSEPAVAKARLFEEAKVLGESLRKKFRIRSYMEAMQLSKILYRLMGIDFCGSAEGDVVIRSCFFSPYYSSQVCGIIAGLDEGLAAGLTAGERLIFIERITEGKTACRAEYAGKAGR